MGHHGHLGNSWSCLSSVSQSKNLHQVLDSLLSSVGDTEPELVSGHQKAGGTAAGTVPSPHRASGSRLDSEKAVPGCPRGPFLTPLPPLQGIPPGATPHFPGRSPEPPLLTNGPVPLCPRLVSPCPFPCSWPRTFVGAAITCFRKRTSL